MEARDNWPLGTGPSELFTTQVVGCYYYGGVDGCYVGEVLHLRRNPFNPHDPNAIEVHTAAGRQVGHLPREVAAWFAPQLDAGVAAHAVITAVDHGYTPARRRWLGAAAGRDNSFRPPRLQVRIMRGSPKGGPSPEPKPQTAPPSGVSPQPGPNPSNCFIVTAACGSPDDELVMFFRRWRDSTLARTQWGRFVVSVYQVVGPHLAKMLNRHSRLKKPVKQLLWRFAAALEHFQ